MLDMFLYAIAVAFSPGPVNFLGLNQGMNNKSINSSIAFSSGVSIAMIILFTFFGYTGEKFIKKEYLFYISLIGSLYIFYLAHKIFISKIDMKTDQNLKNLGFKDGLLMQLFNPKGMLSCLPVATIHFPANNITGIKILFISVILSLLAFCTPLSYSFIGRIFNKLVASNKLINIFNKFMSFLLFIVALSILKDHVILVFLGINQF
jgi:threonine/homoserine/homoserine lactone efflux protein